MVESTTVPCPLGSGVPPSTDLPSATVCHQHYVRQICRRTPSSGHWRRISSHPSSDTWVVFETLPLLINLPTYLLYLLMSTFWRNWDFDTAWWPEHFPISGQSVISVYRRNEQNDYWSSSSNLSGCTKALCPFHLVHEGFKSGRWIIPMPTF